MAAHDTPRGWRFEGNSFAPWPDPLMMTGERSLGELLAEQGYRTEPEARLGVAAKGIWVSVFGVDRTAARRPDSAFVASIHMGEALHHVYVADLPSLLEFLGRMAPIVEASLSAEAERARASSDRTRQVRPPERY